MYRLTLLGSLGIEASGASPPDRAAQPRQLALLALLAASEGPLTRDKLVGYLWPEVEERRARRRLSDTLYVLRQELGSDAVVAMADTLALNRDVIGSDLADFQAALDAGDLEEAVSHYDGPFLDGFYLSGTVAFERWVDGQRQRLARSYRAALETLASSAAERNALREAVRWRRRQVAQEPYSSLAVRRLMEALVEVGDRAAALQAARAYAQTVRSELGASPDAKVVEFVKELRAGGTRVGSSGGRAQSGRAPAARSTGEGAGEADPGRTPAEEGTRGTALSGPAARTGDGWRALRVGGLVLGLLALVGVVWLGVGSVRSGDGASEDGGLPSIAVLPWAVRGDAPDLEYLEEGLADLLSLALDGAPRVRPVDPYGVLTFVDRSCGDPANPECGSAVAHRFGAGRFLKGTVVPLDGGSFQLWASVYDAEGTRLRRTTVRGDRNDLLAAVQELGHRLGIVPSAAGQSADAATEATGMAGRMTPSLSALRAYLEGEAHFRSWHPDEAIRALREAVAADSSFALGWYRLAVTAEMVGGSAAWQLADSATGQAMRRVDRLPDRQRRVLRALDRLQRGQAPRAEREFRDLLAVHPHNFDAWHLLGELRHHYNVVRGRPPDGEAAFRRVRGLNPDFRPALWHLRLEALSEGRIADFDSLTQRFLAVAPEPGETSRGPGRTVDRSIRVLEDVYARLARADHNLVGLLRAADDAARERWFADLERADGDELAWVAGLHFEHLSWPDRRRDAVRMARILTRPTRSRSERARGFVILGSIALRAGRWRDALTALDSLETLAPAQAALWRADWASTRFLRLKAETLSEIRTELAETLADSTRPGAVGLPLGPAGWTTIPPPDVRAWGLSRLALLSIRLEELEEARRYAARLAGTSELGRDFQLVLRAEMHRKRGIWDGARATLDSVRYEVRWDQLTASLHPYLFLRAEILYALGELEEARRWYTLWTHLSGPRFLGPALRRLGQIHEALGEPKKALSRYGEFVSLWHAADSELQPWVEEARDRIAALRSSDD